MSGPPPDESELADREPSGVGGQRGRTVGVVTKLKSQYDWDEVASLLAGGDAPTDDDVSVTVDGRRLDSAQAVIAFFEDLQAEHAANGGHHG